MNSENFDEQIWVLFEFNLSDILWKQLKTVFFNFYSYLFFTVIVLGLLKVN